VKSCAWLLFVMLAAASAWAKPKVAVKVKADEGLIRDRPTYSLSPIGVGPSTQNTIDAPVVFMNVTVASDNGQAVALNNGQWCVTGGIKLELEKEYDGTLDGNNLDILIPQKNGKMKKEHYEIVDHKWRKLTEL